jgi:hypothetical protein
MRGAALATLGKYVRGKGFSHVAFSFSTTSQLKRACCRALSSSSRYTVAVRSGLLRTWMWQQRKFNLQICKRESCQTATMGSSMNTAMIAWIRE